MKFRNSLSTKEQWQLVVFGFSFVGVMRFLANWRAHHPNYTPLNPDTVEWLTSVYTAAQNNRTLNAVGIVIVAIVVLFVLKYFLTKPRIY